VVSIVRRVVASNPKYSVRHAHTNTVKEEMLRWCEKERTIGCTDETQSILQYQEEWLGHSSLCKTSRIGLCKGCTTKSKRGANTVTGPGPTQVWKFVQSVDHGVKRFRGAKTSSVNLSETKTEQSANSLTTHPVSYPGPVFLAIILFYKRLVPGTVCIRGMQSNTSSW
jgi:hypothetical protein